MRAFARAIDARRFEQLVRQRQRILPHQEDAEDARHRRDDDAAVRVHESQLT